MTRTKRSAPTGIATVSRQCWSLFVLLALTMSACSSVSSPATGGPSSDEVRSCDEVSPIVELLQSGLPTYDYDPAPSLAALIEQSEVVVAGTLMSAERVVGVVDEESGDESWTLILTAEHEELYAADSSLEELFGADRSFVVNSNWAQRDVIDPLAEPVEFDSAQTRFVAFLRRTQNPAAPWSVLIQGLHVGCGAQQMRSVIEPLPAGLSGSADEMTEAIVAIVDPQVPRDDANYRSIPYRLLVEDVAAGDPYSVRHIEDSGQVRPEVGDISLDLENSVVFEFVLAESGTCDLGPLERLEFDRVNRVLYPVLRNVGDQNRDCTSDANPHLILVAVPRRDLPTGEFSIAVSEDGWPGEFMPLTFTAGQLTRVGPEDVDVPILGDPAELAVGETGVLVGYTTHCDTDYLWWIVNDLTWVRSGTGSAEVPADWRAVQRDQAVDLQIRLIAEDMIEAVALGAQSTLSFEPAADQQQIGCD